LKYSWQLKLAARLCGIAIFIYILMGIDIQNLLATTFGIPPVYTIILILFVLPIMLVRGTRWKVITEGLDLTLSVLQATGALCLSHLANLVIPGSLGDLVRVPYMKQLGNRVDRSIISILVDAVLGSIVPFTTGIFAITIILEINITLELFLLCIVWIIGGYCVYRVIHATLWPRLMQARMRRLMRDGLRGKSFFTFPSILTSIGKASIALSLSLSVLLFGLYITQAYILAISLDMSIDWLYLAVTLGLTSLLTAIPITIQGLGLREGVLLFMLTPLGFGPVRIISFSLTLMLVNLIPAIAGFVIWSRNPFIDITNQEILDAEGEEPPFSYLDLE